MALGKALGPTAAARPQHRRCSGSRGPGLKECAMGSGKAIPIAPGVAERLRPLTWVRSAPRVDDSTCLATTLRSPIVESHLTPIPRPLSPLIFHGQDRPALLPPPACRMAMLSGGRASCSMTTRAGCAAPNAVRPAPALAPRARLARRGSACRAQPPVIEGARQKVRRSRCNDASWALHAGWTCAARGGMRALPRLIAHRSSG